MILPSSHIITGGLVRTDEFPLARGGFADVWTGDHCGNKVSIKVLRISRDNDSSLIKVRIRRG